MIAHRILIVEDERLIAEELRDRLERQGFEVVGVVSSAADAIRGAEVLSPNLVLMDIRLEGDQDGIEAAAAIGTRFHIPVVYLSAHSDDATIERAKLTAPYGFLLKPFHERELQVTIQMAVFKDSLEKKLKEAERREHEMWLARKIQEKFLPVVPQLDGLEIGIVSRPATEASGDYVDLVCMGEHHLGLVIGDVSGHGMAAAMLMAQSRAYLRAVLQCFTEPGQRLSDQLGPTLATLNQHFRNDAPADYFLTLAYARLNRRTHVLEFVGAGHPAGYVLDAAGEVKIQLNSLSLPLGICEAATFPAIPEVRLAPGDLVVLFTDGLYEAHRPEGPMFGKGRILEVVRASRNGGAQQIAEDLHDAVRAFIGDTAPSDDISALIVKVSAAVHSDTDTPPDQCPMPALQC